MTDEKHQTGCKLCQRKFPNFCKRHAPKVTMTTARYYREDEVKKMLAAKYDEWLKRFHDKYSQYNDGCGCCSEDSIPVEFEDFKAKFLADQGKE